MSSARTAWAQADGQLSVLNINPDGIGDPDGQTWEVRSARLVDWLVRQGQKPDIIAFQQIDGWLWTHPLRSCARGLGRGPGDYEQFDILMSQLRDRLGITYRIAYMTGLERSYGGVVPCHTYEGHALLYNPTRLVNLTATTPIFKTKSYTERDDVSGIPHLRRSLPICNPNSNPAMPLGSLIDGPPQTDKCARETPSGPVWTVTHRDGHIAATYNRLAYASDPSRIIEVFNINRLLGSRSAT